ncbi:MAG: ATP-binding protein [Caldilineaceae bacterium]
MMNLFRRIEWLIVISYFLIVIVEIIVLRNLSGSPEANIVRYLTFFGVVLLSFVVVRQQIVKPIQEMRAASLQIAEGEYSNRLPIYNNLELNELAQAFNEMTATIEQSEQRRVELIGDVAHELRTPLNNIKITLEGLIDEVISADSTTFFDMQREISRLQRLISQLEILSRAESDQIVLHKQSAPLDALLHSLTGRLAIQFEDKGVALEVDISADFPLIPIDSDRITQVVTNIVGNALQYTPPGGRVVVSATYNASHATIAVKDTGAGLNGSDLTRIFERFYRVDKSRQRGSGSGGNGIGLTIAKHLVQAHGGNIWANSSGYDQGTTIAFTLPRSKN